MTLALIGTLVRKGIIAIVSGGLDVVGNAWVSVAVAVAPDVEKTTVSLC